MYNNYNKVDTRSLAIFVKGLGSWLGSGVFCVFRQCVLVVAVIGPFTFFLRSFPRNFLLLSIKMGGRNWRRLTHSFVFS